MTEIDQLETQIDQQFEQVEKELAAFKKKEPSQRLKHLQKCEQKCKTLKYTIESLELEVSSLDRVKALKFSETLKGIKQRMQDIRNDIEFKKSELSSTKALFVERKQEKRVDEMNGSLPLYLQCAHTHTQDRNSLSTVTICRASR